MDEEDLVDQWYSQHLGWSFVRFLCFWCFLFFIPFFLLDFKEIREILFVLFVLFGSVFSYSQKFCLVLFSERPYRSWSEV